MRVKTIRGIVCSSSFSTSICNSQLLEYIQFPYGDTFCCDCKCMFLMSVVPLYIRFYVKCSSVTVIVAVSIVLAGNVFSFLTVSLYFCFK